MMAQTQSKHGKGIAHLSWRCADRLIVIAGAVKTQKKTGREVHQRCARRHRRKDDQKHPNNTRQVNINILIFLFDMYSSVGEKKSLAKKPLIAKNRALPKSLAKKPLTVPTLFAVLFRTLCLQVCFAKEL